MSALWVCSCRDVDWVSLTQQSGNSGAIETNSSDTDSVDQTQSVAVDSCELVVIESDASLEVFVDLQSQWESGSCYAIELANAGDEAVIWQLRLRIGGTLASTWDCVSSLEGEDVILRGDPATPGAAIASGGILKTGLCMACTP